MQNIASEEGGALKWIGRFPNLGNNKFLNNLGNYGQNVASYPIRLKFQLIDFFSTL